MAQPKAQTDPQTSAMPHPQYRHRVRATRGRLRIKNLDMITKLIKGDFLSGKKTFISIGIGLAGFFANKYGVKHEFDGVVEIISLNSAEIVTLIGLIGGIWGRIVAKPKSGK